jgi:hypothetical protein
MKRKQFASLLLAGVLAVGTLPGMVYAETETTAAVQSIETDNSDADSEENDTTETGDSLQNAPTDTSADSEADPSDAPAETPAAQGTTPTAAATSPAATPTTQPEDTRESEAAPANEESQEESALDALIRDIQAAVDGSETEIPVSGTLEITQEITIPEGKKIVLVPSDEQSVIFKRGDDFTGDLFVLESNASLTISGTKKASVTIDGNTTVQAKGSLISVSEKASLILGDFVTLQNNKTTGTGGAVRNDKGTLVLRNVTIKDNQAKYGGAICSNAPIQIGDDTCTDDVDLTVSGNKNENGEDDNLYLLGEDALISVQSAFKESSVIGVSVSDTSRTSAVIETKDDTIDLEKDVLPYIKAEQEGCSIDSKGKLSVETPVTETPTPTATVTPTPAPTSTPKPTPTATVTPDALKITGVAWVNKDSLSITFKNYLNKAGTAYYAIVPDGTDFNKLDTTGSGISVAAGGSVTFTIDNSEQGQVIPDGVFRVYLQVIYKDSAKTRSQIYPIKITQDNRPTPTPTPAPTTRAPLIYSASDSTVTGLSGKITAYTKKLHYFTVVGAGTDNTDPQEGDVKWEPQYWKAGSTKHNEGKNGNFYMIFAKDYTEDKDITIKVNYKKYIYRNGSWQEAGEEDVPYTITVTPSTAEEDPELQTGAGTIATPETLAEEGVTISENATPSSNATTDDTTPLGMWFATLITALAAAGFVLYRKRI